MVLFGGFCALAGARPIGVYELIYKAAFGSWFSIQNTLIRAAPIMLCALCTALPLRLGLLIIGNEGALVMGGIGDGIGRRHLDLGAALGGPDGHGGGRDDRPAGAWVMAMGAMKIYRGVNET